MTLQYLLDTNVLSEPTKAEPNKKIVSQLFQHQFSICTAAQVLYELQTGAARLPFSKRRDKLQNYIDSFVLETLPILPYDQHAANWHAKQTETLTNNGVTPAFVDAQIAAIAYVNDLTLVTRNVDDFVLFEGLRIKNWHG